MSDLLDKLFSKDYDSNGWRVVQRGDKYVLKEHKDGYYSVFRIMTGKLIAIKNVTKFDTKREAMIRFNFMESQYNAELREAQKEVDEQRNKGRETKDGKTGGGIMDTLFGGGMDSIKAAFGGVSDYFSDWQDNVKELTYGEDEDDNSKPSKKRKSSKNNNSDDDDDLLIHEPHYDI